MLVNPENRNKISYNFRPAVWPGTRQPVLYRLFTRVKAGNILHIFAATCQVVSGLVLVYLSILGVVQKLWLATVLSGLGSVVTMLGGYLLYDVLRNHYTIDHLVRNAINRAINSQN